MSKTGFMSKLKETLEGKAVELNAKIEKTLEAVDEEIDVIKKLKAEEQQKMQGLGTAAYIENLKADTPVYGEVSEKTMDKLGKIYERIKNLEENDAKRRVGEGTIYGIGVHYRRKMLKNKNTGGN